MLVLTGTLQIPASRPLGVRRDWFPVALRSVCSQGHVVRAVRRSPPILRSGLCLERGGELFGAQGSARQVVAPTPAAASRLSAFWKMTWFLQFCRTLCLLPPPTLVLRRMGEFGLSFQNSAVGFCSVTWSLPCSGFWRGSVAYQCSCTPPRMLGLAGAGCGVVCGSCSYVACVSLRLSTGPDWERGRTLQRAPGVCAAPDRAVCPGLPRPAPVCPHLCVFVVPVSPCAGALPWTQAPRLLSRASSPRLS